MHYLLQNQVIWFETYWLGRILSHKKGQANISISAAQQWPPRMHSALPIHCIRSSVKGVLSIAMWAPVFPWGCEVNTKISYFFTPGQLMSTICGNIATSDIIVRTNTYTIVWLYLREPTFSRCDMPACDVHTNSETDRQTDTHDSIYLASMALHYCCLLLQP